MDTVSRPVRLVRKAEDAFSSKRTRQLTEKQPLLGLPDHKLIHGVSTRWGSTAKMIDRFLEQQQAVCAVFHEDRKLWHLMPLDDDMVTLADLREVVGFLSQFTDTFSELTFVTVLSTMPVLQYLYTKLEANENDKPLVTRFKNTIFKNLKDRYEPHLGLLNVYTFLGARFKDSLFSADEKAEVLLRIQNGADRMNESNHGNLAEVPQVPQPPSHSSDSGLDSCSGSTNPATA